MNEIIIVAVHERAKYKNEMLTRQRETDTHRETPMQANDYEQSKTEKYHRETSLSVGGRRVAVVAVGLKSNSDVNVHKNAFIMGLTSTEWPLPLVVVTSPSPSSSPLQRFTAASPSSGSMLR